MRINKYIASSGVLSRRAADVAVAQGRVLINSVVATPGADVTTTDTVLLDGRPVQPIPERVLIMLNKPVGYVCSRNGQGSPSIYELLPSNYHHLNPIGRLDKDTSGLLLLTNDGHLAQDLSHPSKQKNKVYEVELDRPMQPLHRQMISDHGVMLEDGISKFELERIGESNQSWKITMHEGRNRQIRRTFKALGYGIKQLHRTTFGPYDLATLEGHSSHYVIEVKPT